MLDVKCNHFEDFAEAMCYKAIGILVFTFHFIILKDDILPLFVRDNMTLIPDINFKLFR